MNNVEDGLKELINSFVNKAKDEDFTAIKHSIVKLEEEGFELESPEKFTLNVAYKTNRYVRTVIEYFCREKKLYDKNRYIFVYSNYSFLKNNIECLIATREGNSYSADKTRFVLDTYLAYTITGNVEKFNVEGIEYEEGENEYFIPKFGTAKEWIEYCNGLYELYHGRTTRYYNSCKALLESEVRMYLHLLHTWYIKFKDGKTYVFSYTWDEDVDCPLDNEYFNKKDFYLIDRKLISDRGYSVYEGTEGVIATSHRFLKIPKEDIEKIYKKTVEQYL